MEQSIETYAEQLQNELSRAKRLLEVASGKSLAFDIRGQLYAIAHRIAPAARQSELNTLCEWISPSEKESAVDIACGSGFLTRALLQWGCEPVFAVDTSITQLRSLREYAPNAKIVCGRPDQRSILGSLPAGNVDVVTSLGGIHHIENQAALFANVAAILRKGGRFVFADVCDRTSVARHFDEIVANKCLTGHSAQWLDENRVRSLAKGSHLVAEKVRIEPCSMTFTSVEQMYYFFKGLHAYDLPMQEVIDDLANVLGVTRNGTSVHVAWPLLFGELRKYDPAFN